MAATLAFPRIGLAVVVALVVLVSTARVSAVEPPLPPRVRVEGRVAQVEGETLTLVTHTGRVVRADLSGVPDMARRLLTIGREVEVSGLAVTGGELLADSVEVDYGDPVSASP
jgi:hypothetical protein